MYKTNSMPPSTKKPPFVKKPATGPVRATYALWMGTDLFSRDAMRPGGRKNIFFVREIVECVQQRVL